VAPFATASEQLSILVAPSIDLARLATSAGLRSVEEGANVSFLISNERSPFMFRQNLHDAWVASNVQLYLDLFSSPARGREQARHLRIERLGY
jgi:hypothetical protein